MERARCRLDCCNSVRCAVSEDLEPKLSRKLRQHRGAVDLLKLGGVAYGQRMRVIRRRLRVLLRILTVLVSRRGLLLGRLLLRWGLLRRMLGILSVRWWRRGLLAGRLLLGFLDACRRPARNPARSR